MAAASPKKTKKSSNVVVGFESTLCLAADKLRNNLDAAEYKHVVLGLIFLKYISDAFEEMRAKLIEAKGDYQRSQLRGPRRIPRRTSLLAFPNKPAGPTSNRTPRPQEKGSGRPFRRRYGAPGGHDKIP